MLEFPRWFKEAMPMLECPSCHKAVEEGSIVAEGIRKSIAYKDNTAFFIEYKCSHCNNVTTMELTPMTLEDFVMEMLEIFTADDREGKEGNGDKEESKPKAEKEIKKESHKKITRKTNTNGESKMSSDEIVEFKKMLKTCQSNEDFLSNIGVTEEMRKRWEEDYKDK